MTGAASAGLKGAIRALAVAALIAMTALASLSSPSEASAVPLGQWVTFMRDEGRWLTQVSEYYVTRTNSTTYNVRLRTTITASADNPYTYFSTTKTIYDNGRQVAYIGPDWRTGKKLTQEASFTITGPGNHHITSIEEAFRGEPDVKAGWDFTIVIPYNLKVTHSGSGTTNPAGDAYVDPGGSKTVTATPSVGSHIADVEVDGSSIGSPSSYTFRNMSANHTVHVTFEANRYVIRYDPNGGEGTMEDTPMTFGRSQALSPNVFTREGHHFTGWNTEPDGSGVSYADEQMVSNLTSANGGIVTLYAQWEPNPHDVSAYVVVDGEPRLIGTQTLRWGDVLDAGSDPWLDEQLRLAVDAGSLPAGTAIDGWWEAPACEGEKAGKMTIHGDTAVYCRPVEAEVRYYADRWDEPVWVETAYVGAVYEVDPQATTAASRPGCTPGLDGWYTDPDDGALLSDEPGADGESRYAPAPLPEEGIDLYAVNRVTLTFAQGTSGIVPSPDTAYRTEPSEDAPAADFTLPASRTALWGKPFVLPGMELAFEPLGDGRWRTLEPVCWTLTDDVDGDPISLIAPERDTTLWVMWRNKTSDGIVDRRG